MSQRFVMVVAMALAATVAAAIPANAQSAEAETVMPDAGRQRTSPASSPSGP